MDKQIWYISCSRTLLTYKNATVWMNLKVIMLNERSPTQKNTYCMISLIQNSRECKLNYSDKANH